MLYFGGDYELLVTLNPDELEKCREALANFGTKLTPVGKVLQEKKNTIIKDGMPNILKDRGYEHFRWKP